MSISKLKLVNMFDIINLNRMGQANACCYCTYRTGFSYDDLLLYATLLDGFTAV